MLRARQHLIDHDLVTVPAMSGSTSSRRPSTCATSSRSPRTSPGAVRPDPKGIYVVTPSVGDDPDAMREHNLASISNTSIHEAYPGHHLQLDGRGGTRR